ncbi:HNH endonuclease signature motif containing protein [Corynebacterium aquatimens]|uniref:HNH nuclease domain-containing protein n=1 Tax=Corynebacterium aquatimens TaxID=1190508 RepID=A0A931E045_9CORY|nr:HNH endonuclease signature motif containing protein [Corynebacterium aquatimens]MBG6122254.1 hypothetical protein [Corynebacterium aquatimens]WJY65205.1 HNH endonuclease [Corynebacterium aquatimens]
MTNATGSRTGPPSSFAAYYAAVAGSALDIVATFDAELARSGALDTSHVSDLEKLHKVYFGATKFVAKQRDAREYARQASHSLDRLIAIERRLTHIKNASEQWRLRLALLRVGGSIATLKREAKKIVPREQKPPQPGVRFSRSRERMRSVTITAAERDIEDLERHLNESIDSNAPAGPQLADAFVDLIRGDDGAGVRTAVPEPLILVPLEEHIKIAAGHGDDVTLQLTDGTTVTGAEYLDTLIARMGADDPFLQAAIFHPTEGAVNLYDTQRFANDKQRTLLRATSPMCIFPGCRRSADHCEYHHITPWKRGGPTNLTNLTVMCSYHNRVNDDDPHISKRGAAAHIDGDKVWVSPHGFPVQHDVNAQRGAMALLFGPRRYQRTEHAS